MARDYVEEVRTSFEPSLGPCGGRSSEALAVVRIKPPSRFRLAPRSAAPLRSQPPYPVSLPEIPSCDRSLPARC